MTKRLPADSFVAIVMGPSGVGKSTIIEKMLVITELPYIKVNKSWVTREPREKETTDVYTFVNEDEFKRAEAEGRFLQVQKIYDNYYGTLWPEAVSDNTVELFNLVPKGAAEVKAQYPSAKIYLIEPPSMSELRERLEGRGITDLDDLMMREKAAEAELKAGKAIADHHVINRTGKPEETARELHDLIKADWERSRA